MTKDNLLDPNQSAYRQGHSTETLFMHVSDIALPNLDNSKCTALLMLDLSAAFDTLDHPILLHTLYHHFGVCSTALKWFQSFLSNRTQCVKIAESMSETRTLSYGAPQGSVLAGLLVTIFMTPLQHVINMHGNVTTKLKISITTRDQPDLDPLTKCIVDIRRLMNSYFLKLNEEKTELLVISKPQINMHLSLSIGSASVLSAETIRNLGVYFDRNLTFDKHISHLVQVLSLQLRLLSTIRSKLTFETCMLFLHYYFFSRLDYCLAVLYGLPDTSINRLQRLMNRAARILTGHPFRQSITPVLNELGWLKVRNRCTLRLLTHVFQCLHNNCPTYLRNKVQYYIPCRHLRSQTKSLLQVPQCKTAYGSRAFSVAGPNLFNLLPIAISKSNLLKNFKEKLYSHFLNSQY